MEDYSFSAHLLSTYAQLTPWVQVSVVGLWMGGLYGMLYCVKEMVVAWPRSRAALYIYDACARIITHR